MIEFERGFIMLCTDATEEECLKRNLFGDQAKRLENLDEIEQGDIGLLLNFNKEELIDIQNRITKVLTGTFKENGYAIFDLKFYEKPEVIDESVKHFWGGYAVEFKIIESDKFRQFEKEDDLRRNAIVVGEKNSTKYLIEISKYEFVDKKADFDIEGYTVYAYTPEMIVCEKIRALCQQVPGYKEIVKSITPKSRSRDFFDIFTLVNHFNLDITSDENIELLRNVMKAKNVPLAYLSEITVTRKLHEMSYPGLRDTLTAGVKIESFDNYFEYVARLCDEVHTKLKDLMDNKDSIP